MIKKFFRLLISIKWWIIIIIVYGYAFYLIINGIGG
jgi:hypothetical protein